MNKIVSNNSKVKQLNIELVKDALIELTYATTQTVAKTTGLSIATCGNILNELLESGEVIEVDLEQPKGGRPARRFMYNANYCYVACIYLNYKGGDYKITYAVANLINEIIEEDSVILDDINYESIVGLIDKLIAKHDNIRAVGVGVPAAVCDDVLVGDCEIKGLINFPLGKRLKEKYPINIIVENDMNLKVLGLYKKQNYDKHKNIAVITFPKNSCIGSGIVVDGHVVKGNTQFAGEVSYLPFDISQEELITQLQSVDGFLPIVVKTIVSIIAVINPETIALTGELVRPDMLEDIFNGCLKIIPEKHMPKIIIRENIHDDYINGLISVTIESLTCDFKLVKKRI
jgi:predicted NBD/HSP70 family sugar kinase